MSNPTRSYLATWLDEDLHLARLKPSVHRKRLTSGGLKIELYVDRVEPARLHLLLGRTGAKPPSDQEAKTVIEHLPAWARPATPPKWNQVDLGSWRCLTSMWPLSAEQGRLL